MIFDKWFPMIIGRSECPFITEIQAPYKELIKKFKTSEKTGWSYHAVHEDERFKKLNNWVNKEVNVFAKAHKFPDEYEAKQSWLINYKKGETQPSHSHPGYTISTIFFLEGYEDDAPLIFRNPQIDMKNPLHTTPSVSNDHRYYNDLTYISCSYRPRSGAFLLWRSYGEHSVPIKLNNKKRIVFVYNCDPKRKNK